MSFISFKATKDDENRTIYKYILKMLPNLTRSHLEKLFRKKEIKINQKKINQNNKNYKLKINDEILIYGIYEEEKSIFDVNQEKSLINFKIIYEDENILIINKPINISVHGFYDSLDNQVKTYLNFKPSSSFSPSHVGRLDKDTSGLIIYAKNYSSLVELNQKQKNFEKYYKLKSDFPWKRKKIIYEEINPKTNKKIFMETIFFKEKNESFALLVSGKKHQIRKTLSSLKYPIYGDLKYNGKKEKRLFLHSYKIIFHNLESNLKYLNEKEFICDVSW